MLRSCTIRVSSVASGDAMPSTEHPGHEDVLGSAKTGTVMTSMAEWAIRVKDLRKQYPRPERPGARGQRDRPGDRARRVLRPARPQRRGQDDHRRDPRGAQSADIRRGRGPRPALGDRRDGDPRADRRDPPGDPAARQGDRARDRHAVPELLQERARARRRDRAGRAGEQGERLHRAALGRPAAAAGRRAVAWSATPRSSSSTSRRPGWTRNPAASSGT